MTQTLLLALFLLGYPQESGAPRIRYGVRTGTTGSWYAECTDDRIDDERNCMVCNNDNQQVAVGLYKDGTILVIGGRGYPGSENAIRIDGAQPVKWNSDRLTTAELRLYQKAISQMLNGKRYVARSYGWPDRNEIINEGTLDGFKEAYEWAQKALKAYPAKPMMPQSK